MKSRELSTPKSGDFMERQEETNARQEETNARVERRLQQITDDLGDLKGHVAGRIAREMADDIAERLGFELVEALNGQDLRRMLRQHNPGDIGRRNQAQFLFGGPGGQGAESGRQRAVHRGGGVLHRGPKGR